MRNTNLVCVGKPTITLTTSSEDNNVKPIGLVVLKISELYPQSFVNKVYSSYFRGDATDKGVISDFMRGNVPYIQRPIDSVSFIEVALTIVHDRFKPPRNFRPVHFADLRFYPWELSTSAEEPLISDPVLVKAVKDAHQRGDIPNTRMSKTVLYNAAFELNRAFVHNIKETPNPKRKKINFFPTKAHARSHLTPIEDEAKIRMVFGVPWLFLMVELMLLWPLFNWLRKGKTPIAWTYEIMNGGMNKINSLTQENDLYLCLDWKQFDKRVQYDIIDKIHDMWMSWMIMTEGYIPTSNYPDKQSKHDPKSFEIRIKRLWKWMNQYLKDMTIVLPDGSMWTKQFAGIASGMLQTQVLDSFVNLVMLITVLLYIKFPIPEIALVLGDDSLLMCRNMGSIDSSSLLNSVADASFKIFGAVINTSKSIITNDKSKITFLSYTNSNGTPTRDITELLAKFVHPERKWDSCKVKARALGFAYANCGVDERVHILCENVFNALHHVRINEAGSPFLRYYRETVGSYDTDVFPTRKSLLEKLFVPVDRKHLDERFWPSWFFLDEY